MDELLTLNLTELGFQIKAHREQLKLTQDKLAEQLGEGVNRSHISYLEKGTRVPPPEILTKIGVALAIPKKLWELYLSPDVNLRLEFEVLLQELSGSVISSAGLDRKIIKVIEDEIIKLFSQNLSIEHSLDQLNTIVVFYGVKPVSKPLFDRYLKKHLASPGDFHKAILNFQKDAIRLFSSLHDAYSQLNTESYENFTKVLEPITPRETDEYTKRTEWNKIERIRNEDLPYLGYIAVSRVKKETAERKEVSDFLLEIAEKKKKNQFNINEPGTAKRRRIDSLLRKFDSTIEHGLFSPLFSPDLETLEKEARRLSPKSEDIEIIEVTQAKAYRNLANYLTADYLDIYVATSMRTNAEFISVNNFVESLFTDNQIRGLKLRYFNPTQSWIGDRVGKGLVEALMSIQFEKRADIFRNTHPLALQVILSTGVLNGILVVRSVEICAKLIKALIENNLELEFKSDEDDDNYRLVEKNTNSTIRVISKHKLISNAFKTFYQKAQN